jgi:hypothetical protein
MANRHLARARREMSLSDNLRPWRASGSALQRPGESVLADGVQLGVRWRMVRFLTTADTLRETQSSRSSDETMAVRIVCQFGKRLREPDATGTSVRCPSCDRVTRVRRNEEHQLVETCRELPGLVSSILSAFPFLPSCLLPYCWF